MLVKDKMDTINCRESHVNVGPEETNDMKP